MKWFALWQAILAGFSVVTAGTMLSDLVGLRVAGTMVLISAGLQAGTSAYVAAITKPAETAQVGMTGGSR